jgi:hypothetical protein
MAAMYEQRIDTARKIVAVMFGLCGAGVVVCANRAHHVRRVLGQDPGAWGWVTDAFATAMFVCLGVTFALVVEGVVRFIWNFPRQARIQFRLRTLLIVMTLVALALGLIASIVGPP